MALSKRLGMVLLGIWLIATGIIQIFCISFLVLGIILAIVAIVAGLLLIFGK